MHHVHPPGGLDLRDVPSVPNINNQMCCSLTLCAHPSHPSSQGPFNHVARGQAGLPRSYYDLETWPSDQRARITASAALRSPPTRAATATAGNAASTAAAAGDAAAAASPTSFLGEGASAGASEVRSGVARRDDCRGTVAGLSAEQLQTLRTRLQVVLDQL